MSEVGITYDLREFNGSLLKENIYRQDASPEVVAAWDALGVNCAIPVGISVLNSVLTT